MILYIAIISHSLFIMASLAQRLPVGLIPEEFLVTSVGYDVIDHCRLHVPTFLLALHTEGMHLQENLSYFTPPTIISSANSRTCLLCMKGLMLFTVLLPIGYQGWTARILTRYARSTWHGILLKIRFLLDSFLI